MATRSQTFRMACGGLAPIDQACAALRGRTRRRSAWSEQHDRHGPASRCRGFHTDQRHARLGRLSAACGAESVAALLSRDARATSRRRCTAMDASVKPGQQPGAPSARRCRTTARTCTSRGRAAYTDDLPEPRDLLHLAVGMSAKPHARIRDDRSLAPFLRQPGVVDVCVAADIPGENNYGPIVDDDPILADELVQYVGQPLFAVAADSVDSARKAARRASIDYEELEPILDPLTAVAKAVLRAAERNAACAAIRMTRSKSRRIGCSGALARRPGPVLPRRPDRDGHSAGRRRPAHLQLDAASGRGADLVAHATDRAAKDIVVICRRMGGAFGGKESQAALIAASRPRGGQDRPCLQAAAGSRRRHDHDRQASRLCHRLRRRLR